MKRPKTTLSRRTLGGDGWLIPPSSTGMERRMEREETERLRSNLLPLQRWQPPNRMRTRILPRRNLTQMRRSRIEFELNWFVLCAEE